MSESKKPGVMFIAAHQDDAEGSAGGLFAKLRKKLDFRGIVTCFTDGSVGHYETKYLRDNKKLTEIRDAEASRAANVYGFKYQRLLDNEGNPFKDARLEVNWKTRGAVWKAIRDFEPDLIITLPVNDATDPYGMHNDHSNVGEIVKRTAYLIPAPLAFPEYYEPSFINNLPEGFEFPYVKPPIIVTVHDPYSGKVEPDIIISLSADEVEQKARAWAEHVSQWKEWLPWIGRYPAPEDVEALIQSQFRRSDRLSQSLPIKPKEGEVFEAFTITKWALRVPTLEEIKKYFPDDVLNYESARRKIELLSQ